MHQSQLVHVPYSSPLVARAIYRRDDMTTRYFGSVGAACAWLDSLGDDGWVGWRLAQ